MPDSHLEPPDRSTVIVTYKLYHGVADDLKIYLNNIKTKHVWLIAHEFLSFKTRRSYYEHYEYGSLVDSGYSRDYRYLPDTLVYLVNAVYTFFWMATKVRRVDVYFGLGGINAAIGSILKYLGLVKRVVFYAIDYVPKRFDNNLLNSLYHYIDRQAFLSSTEVWNLSPRMSEGREKYDGLKAKLYSHQKVVPVGVWLQDINLPPFSAIHKNELIFVGHLSEKQGVQLVLSAVPEIVKSLPDFTFTVIGGGDYAQKLTDLTSELNISSYVNFLGPIFDQKIVNEKITHAAAAVAMYDRKTDSFTYFADPTKIKTYLACGVPVLLTDVPHNAHDLEDHACGKIITYDKTSIQKAIVQLLKNDLVLKKYHDNARKYMQQYDWNTIYDLHVGRIFLK